MLIGFVAGEASGDLLAAPVITALRERLPHAQFAGIAGDRMVEAGATAWWHVRELSVRGYAEVLRELPRLLQMRAALRDRLLAGRPAVMVGRGPGAVLQPDARQTLGAGAGGGGLMQPIVVSWEGGVRSPRTSAVTR